MKDFVRVSTLLSSSQLIHNIVASYFICSAMLHLESQMPLSLGRHSFGAASGDCVNICTECHFGLGVLYKHDWAGA